MGQSTPVSSIECREPNSDIWEIRCFRGIQRTIITANIDVTLLLYKAVPYTHLFYIYEQNSIWIYTDDGTLNATKSSLILKLLVIIMFFYLLINADLDAAMGKYIKNLKVHYHTCRREMSQKFWWWRSMKNKNTCTKCRSSLSFYSPPNRECKVHVNL